MQTCGEPNVTAAESCTGPCTTRPLPSRLMGIPPAAGVVLKGGETLAADLVVDASGRLSKVQSWLAEGGYATPRSVEVNSCVGYSDAVFDVPPEVRRRCNPQAPTTSSTMLSSHALCLTRARPGHGTVMRTPLDVVAHLQASGSKCVTRILKACMTPIRLSIAGQWLDLGRSFEMARIH